MTNQGDLAIVISRCLSVGIVTALYCWTWRDVEDEVALEFEEPLDNPATTTATTSWLAVIFDHWPTRRNNRARRRACLPIGLQACLLFEERNVHCGFLIHLHFSIGCNHR